MESRDIIRKEASKLIKVQDKGTLLKEGVNMGWVPVWVSDELQIAGEPLPFQINLKVRLTKGNSVLDVGIFSYKAKKNE